MADELETVKEIIVSLLIVEKGTMTIPQLEREYRSSEGCGLPYARFGCANVRQFLNKISDSVSIQRGSNGEELVSVKVNTKVQHINRMVQQQKPSAAKNKGKHTKLHMSQRGRSSRGRSFGRGRGRSYYNIGTWQQPSMAPQQSSAPLPAGYSPPSSRSELLPSPVPSHSPVSSALNGKDTGETMSRLHNYLAERASVSRSDATGSPVCVNSTYSAGTALANCSTQGIKCEELQPGPSTTQQEWSSGDFEAGSELVSTQKHKFCVPHNSIVDRWKELSSSVSSPTYHGTTFSGAYASSHFQAAVRPSLLNSFTFQPVGQAPTCSSGYSAEQAMYSMLNPNADLFQPILAQSATTEGRQEVKENIACKETADKQTRAVVELNSKETSTVDLTVHTPDGFSDCVKILLEEHACGLEIETLLEMCKERMGSSAYFMCDRLPLEMVRDVLSSVSSVCVVSDSEGKYTVQLLDSSRSEKMLANLPDDLSSGLMTVLLDYPQGLDVPELLSLYESKFGRHNYIGTHGQCLVDFIRNVVISLPHTTLTHHGDGVYTVKLYRENSPDHQVVHIGNPVPLSSADESDTSEDASAYSVQSLPKSQTFSVLLGEVFSPSEFYILVAENDLPSRLEDLMTELDKFYSKTPADFYTVDRRRVKPGFLCAAQYPIDGNLVWHRAVVKSVKGHMVYVSYIDYGTLTPVKVRDIRKLRPDFLELPAQAVKASLADVKPSGADSWQPDANDHFLQLARMGPCTCSIVSKEEDSLIVKLERSSGSFHYSFGDVLVSEGLAVSAKETDGESFVQTWALPGGYTADVITWNAVQYMSGLGISKLFGEQSDVVSERLAEKGITFKSAVLDRECYPELHYEICCSEGILSDNIRLYYFRNVPDILRVLEHPLKMLGHEIANLSESGPVSRPRAHVSSNGREADSASEDSTAFRQDLQTKLETFKKRRAALRLLAYKNPDGPTLSELDFVEKKVASIQMLLDMNSASQAQDAEEASKSSNTDFKCHSESIATNSSQNVVDKFKVKLLEALMTSKSK
uniref:Putative a kinase anchor protein n=1 Tax=Amblyomma triste TaxID=251400 RepID=A0A023GCB6_AMBTT